MESWDIFIALDAMFDMLTAIGVLLIIFYFTYMIIRSMAQRKERQIIAERVGTNPDAALAQLNAIQKKTNLYGWLKPAGLVVGIGLGFSLCAILLNSMDFKTETTEWLLIMGMLLIFGGLGMIAAFFLEHKLRQKDGNFQSEE